MSEIKIFKGLVVQSIKELVTNFKDNQNNFILLLLLGFLSCIPWQILGFEENSLPEILNTIVIAFLSLIVVANIILVEKKNHLARPKEKLLYAAPTYLIYTFYTSLLIFVPVILVFAFTRSVLLAVIPGILSGVCLVMVPVSSICVDRNDINYFRYSLKLTRQMPFVLFLFFIMTILIEAIPFSLNLLAGSTLKLVVSLFYSLVEAAFLIVLTKVSVKIFYRGYKR